MHTRGLFSTRSRLIVLATATLLGVGGIVLVPPANARARTVTRTVTSHSPYTEPLTSVDGVGCSGLAAPKPDCWAVVTGRTDFTGTMHGTVHYAERSTSRADGKFGYEGPDYFSDSGIDGCGEGSFVVDTYDGWVDMTQWDAKTNSAPGFNRWRVRPHSGTGGLTGLIGGEGENHWRMYFNDSLTQTWGRGLYTGTITCQVTR